MKTTLTLAAAAALLQGCLIVADSDAPPRRHTPAPTHAPAATADPAISAAASLRLKYNGKLADVFGSARKALEKSEFVITAHNNRGDDNWWLNAMHEGTSVRVEFHRRDHKTFTNLSVILNYGSEYEARRMAKDLHDALGTFLGEQGRD